MDMTRLADCLKYLYRPKEKMTAFRMKSPVARYSLCPAHIHICRSYSLGIQIEKQEIVVEY